MTLTQHVCFVSCVFMTHWVVGHHPHSRGGQGGRDGSSKHNVLLRHASIEAIACTRQDLQDGGRMSARHGWV